MVKVVFIHPDLGIGGAEKAVVDAALALKSRGIDTYFVTSHHDRAHCFPETSDGTLNVTVAGDWIPRSVFGKMNALFAYIRMIYTAVYLVFFSGFEYDAIFCDQISACLPVLRMSGKPIIFYCHFPDLLLTHRTTWLKKLYRMPIDWLEEVTTGLSDKVLVNSKFTGMLCSFKRELIPHPRMWNYLLMLLSDVCHIASPQQTLPAFSRTEPTGKSWESLLWRRYVAHITQQHKQVIPHPGMHIERWFTALNMQYNFFLQPLSVHS